VQLVPPFPLLDKWLLGCAVQGSTILQVPYDDILDVLRGFLAVVPVDEDWYKSEYPDILGFLARNRDESATSHFRKFGYFDGRHPFAEGWRGLLRPILFTGIKKTFKAVVTRDGLRVDIERAALLKIVHELLLLVRVDETWYPTAYPEAAEAISAGVFLSAGDHYVHQGYFEGFLPADVVVDDEWYVSHYPHARRAIECGVAISAKDHFIRIGYGEGCRPTQQGQP
jgi:hypothetical protein